MCNLKVKVPVFLGFHELSMMKSTCLYNLQFIY